MAANTNIEWTDKTWPVIRGCSKKSPGCKNCWAIRDAHRLARNPNPKVAAHFEGLTVIQNGKPNWSGRVRVDWDILQWPMRWRKPSRIFVASSGDLFHEELNDDDIVEVFRAMYKVRRHTYQILTKRPERMADLMPRIYATFGYLGHVWLGTSVEDQERADERRGAMARVANAGANTWVSNEPALGPVDWKGWEFLKWLVSGGESGPGARMPQPDWIRASAHWCRVYGKPFLFKQWGSFLPDQQNPEMTAESRRVASPSAGINVGKKKAGRTLDGRVWNEFPKGMRPAA